MKKDIELTTQTLESFSSEAARVTKDVTAETIAESYQNKKIAWTAFLFILGYHVACLAVFFVPFKWSAVALCLVMHWLTGGVGITLGFHRLLTHRSLKVPKPVEYFLALLGCLACQGGPIKWVAAHRLHHAFSDQQGDPHSPVKSFFWAHMGWCLVKNKIIDNPKEYYRYAPDLAKDKGHVFLDNTYILWTIALAILFYLWGGISFVVWGIIVRTVLVYHVTWFVNSATHVWGYRTYKSDDKSTNLWWVALVSYGEGWHNNHHAFQTSARHGLQWWEFDCTWMVIKTLKLFGLASEIKVPSKNLLAQKLIR